MYQHAKNQLISAIHSQDIYIYISGHKWSTTQSAKILQKQDERNVYAIIKTMCSPGYHHSGFVATHAIGHMMYGSLCAQHHVHKCMSCHGRAHCFHDYNDYIYIYIYVYIYILYICIYIYIYIYKILEWWSKRQLPFFTTTTWKQVTTNMTGPP